MLPASFFCLPFPNCLSVLSSRFTGLKWLCFCRNYFDLLWEETSWEQRLFVNHWCRPMILHYLNFCSYHLVAFLHQTAPVSYEEHSFHPCPNLLGSISLQVTISNFFGEIPVSVLSSLGFSLYHFYG